MLILDFDGTLTDVEEEGVPFTEGYLRDLAALTGSSLEQIRELHARFQAEILGDPTRYAWVMNGLAVAPATVDPYLRIKPIAAMILDELGIVLPTRFRENLFSDILYRDNYRLTRTAFRAGAVELLTEVFTQEMPAAIVTNSHTDAVLSKLLVLAGLYSSKDEALFAERLFGFLARARLRRRQEVRRGQQRGQRDDQARVQALGARPSDLLQAPALLRPPAASAQ